MITKETQARHWAGKDQKIIQSYWDSPPATKRSKWFVEQLRHYHFDTIFEVGFFAGRNLRYISEAFPDAKVGGLEINPKAVKFAQDKLPDAELFCMDLHNIMDIDDTFDIVFTSGVLIHVPPDDVIAAIDKMLTRADKYVMHLEQIGHNEVVAGPKELNPIYKVSDQVQWNPNLVAAYKTFGYDARVFKLPDDCKTNGASELVIVKVGD